MIKTATKTCVSTGLHHDGPCDCEVCWEKGVAGRVLEGPNLRLICSGTHHRMARTAEHEYAYVDGLTEACLNEVPYL